MLRLGLPENHREMVLKDKVPIMTILIRNKCGSFPSLPVNPQPGLSEPFEVILQLHDTCMYIWGEVPRVFIDPHGDS